MSEIPEIPETTEMPEMPAMPDVWEETEELESGVFLYYAAPPKKQKPNKHQSGVCTVEGCSPLHVDAKGQQNDVAHYCSSRTLVCGACNQAFRRYGVIPKDKITPAQRVRLEACEKVGMMRSEIGGRTKRKRDAEAGTAPNKKRARPVPPIPPIPPIPGSVTSQTAPRAVPDYSQSDVQAALQTALQTAVQKAVTFARLAREAATSGNERCALSVFKELVLPVEALPKVRPAPTISSPSGVTGNGTTLHGLKPTGPDRFIMRL